MLLLGAILLAIFVLPAPWGLVLVVAGGLADIAESLVLVRWSKRRRVATGAEALVGRTAVVATLTQVRVAGELWSARSTDELVPGSEVVVRDVDGLTWLSMIAELLGAAAALAGTWQTGPPLPLPRTEVTGAVVRGEIFIAGGYLANGQSSRRVDVYSPKTQRWRRAADLPVGGQPRDGRELRRSSST